MKQSYTYESIERIDLRHYILLAAAVILCAVIGIIITRVSGIQWVQFLFMILPVFIYFIMEITATAGFDAGDSAVEFRVKRKKTRIAYDTIKSIEVFPEYRMIRRKYGAERFCVEKIRFVTTGGEYVFCGRLDTENLRSQPDEEFLRRQVQNSRFTQLKCYIESKMNMI